MGHKSKTKKHKHHKVHSLEEMDMYSTSDIPINPIVDRPSGKKYKGMNKGWTYYDAIRQLLPEWWEEFNGDLDGYGRLKFTTIRLFIKSKTNKHDEQRYLYQMLGPVNKHQNSEVPWLGDWDKRRRNGFGLLDNSDKIKPLLKAIKENLAAADSIKSLVPFLLDDLVQYSNLQKQIHEAFAGKAFLREKHADHQSNRLRFETYKQMLAACTALKVKVSKEIMRLYGVDPDTPQQMRDMVQMAGGIGAAAALTGIAAGQQVPGLGTGIQTPNGTMVAPYTYDALMLAQQLTRHAHTFKKPLPQVIDAERDPSDYEDRKSKSSGKIV